MARRNQGPRLRWFDRRECFYVVWTEHGRSRECSTGTASREQAEAFFANWMQDKGRRTSTGPSDPTEVLVTDLLAEYAEERDGEVFAGDRIAYAISALTDFWQGRKVSEVTKLTCRAYAKKRGRAPGTVRRELGALRAAINAAHDNGRITRPVAVELPDPPKSRDRWLTRQEVARIIREARTPQARLYLPMFILIGIYTGRRKEAILSLRWPQVDLENKTINFEITGRKPTKKARGKIRIPDRLLPHLRRLRKRGTDLGYVIHENGKPLGDVQRGFGAACERAKIEGASPHTLRHTAATWLMQKKTDPWQAAGFLSMSLTTLLKVYGHHHPDLQKEAADNIGRRPNSVRVMSA